MRTLSILLFLASFQAFSQDYIITLKGDSISGSLKILSNDLLDKVQLSTEKKKIFTALQVRTLKLNGETYKPQKLNNSIRFMKVLKSGYLSLYAFKPENQNMYDGRLLVKLDGKFMEVPNLVFKKAIADFLEDCESVAEKVKSNEYGKKNLDGIIDAYNMCINDKTKALGKKIVIQEAGKDKLSAIATLKTKIQQLDDAKSKDALDLLTDMETKVKNGDTIANYQIEALKNLLANTPSVSTELTQVLSFFK